MAAIDFFGHLFLALGPPAAFFGVFIAPKSFVVLLTIFRCARARTRALKPLAFAQQRVRLSCQQRCHCLRAGKGLTSPPKWPC
jgi:hypothetical protein